MLIQHDKIENKDSNTAFKSNEKLNIFAFCFRLLTDGKSFIAQKMSERKVFEIVDSAEFVKKVNSSKSNLDELSLRLDKEFLDSILEFERKLKNKNIDLSIFYKNMNTLKVEFFRGEFRNLFKTGLVTGEYDSISNTIKLSNTFTKECLFHELFHLSSSVYDDETGNIYFGFIQRKKGTFDVGYAITEGYTQYLTEKHFGISNLSYYGIEKIIAGNVEKVIGVKKMESLYFNADLNGLINELAQYSSIELAQEFILAFDFVYVYKENIKSKKIGHLIKEKLLFCREFLDNCSIEKKNQKAKYKSKKNS